MAATLLAATRKGLFELHRGKQGWTIKDRHFLGEPVSMALRDPHDGTLYAAVDLGHFGTKLHRREAGGEWQEITAPSYAGIGEGDEAPSLRLIWCLESNGKGRIWAGTIPGGLFCSDDRGESWQLNRPLWDQPTRAQWFGGGYDQPGIHSICIDPNDAHKLAVGVSCGGVWLSDDNGASWRVATQGMWAEYMPPEMKENPGIQDPHRLVQCAGDTRHFWVQHHNGIFRSTDGCANWQGIEASPSNFGFAVAVHPKMPDTAWFVPAIKDAKRFPVDGKFVVTRTRDGGKTFETLNKGLPQAESYDLVYRHGLAIDNSGDCLAMASTTGSLWITENGGDDWVTVSQNLPPVYALRFIE